MKFKILSIGLLTILLFSCNKHDKITEPANKNTDSISTSIAIESTATEISKTKPESETEEKFTLIKESKQIPGDINKTDIDKLSEPLKAIAALYSGLGGSNCNNGECELTVALGLGKQGSEKQNKLVRKWFPNNKAAEQLIAQDFYIAPNSSSNFSDFKYLIFERKGDVVTVNYDLFTYSHGDEGSIKGPDKYVIKENSIETLNRNIWKDIK